VRRRKSPSEAAIEQDRKRLIQAASDRVYASELGTCFAELSKQLSDLRDQQAWLIDRLMEQGLDDASRCEILNHYDELLHQYLALSEQSGKLSASVTAEITAEMQRQCPHSRGHRSGGLCAFCGKTLCSMFDYR